MLVIYTALVFWALNKVSLFLAMCILVLIIQSRKFNFDVKFFE